MAIERIVDTSNHEEDAEEQRIEVTLRPQSFDEYVGQERLKKNFYTYHHIREQSQELFGFSSLAAKKLFEMLITVQGVGPKAALAILSLGEAEHVRNAIANADSAYLAKASGVGKKTAEGVVVKLSDKVGMPIIYKRAEGVQTEPNTSDEALEALIALGYTLADATKALEGVDGSLSTSKRVREALRNA